MFTCSALLFLLWWYLEVVDFYSVSLAVFSFCWSSLTEHLNNCSMINVNLSGSKSSNISFSEYIWPQVIAGMKKEQMISSSTLRLFFPYLVVWIQNKWYLQVPSSYFFLVLFFFYLKFTNHKTTREKGRQTLTSLYLFLDIRWVIIAETLPLHRISDRTRFGNLYFPNASCWILRHALEATFGASYFE